MAIPNLPDLTKPPGTGCTLRCVIEKDGQFSEVEAYCTSRDAKTYEVHFPPHLYEGDGFTVIAMDGLLLDFESLSDR